MPAADVGPTKLLEGRDELILDPELPIIDTHHHFYDNSTTRYLFQDLLADVHAGHNITDTVYVATQTMMRSSGPISLRPLGELEFANGVAAQSASGEYGPTRICAGLLGYADLTTGVRIAAPSRSLPCHGSRAIPRDQTERPRGAY